jgi:hypothetical protein
MIVVQLLTQFQHCVNFNPIFSTVNFKKNCWSCIEVVIVSYLKDGDSTSIQKLTEVHITGLTNLTRVSMPN